MKKNLLVLVLLTITSSLVFRESFKTFFAQDDFILINEFSQNNLITDIKNTFGPPRVTHWRPIHNLYFLMIGNLFNKNHVAYHFLTFAFHLGVAFLIFKIIREITGNSTMASISSFVYATHSVHFVTLFWISGGATTIGFSFLLTSFYFYLRNSNWQSTVFFVLSVLASEAMLAGLGLFAIYDFVFVKDHKIKSSMKTLFFISVFFAVVRFIFLTPKSTFSAYQIKITPDIFLSIKYYLFRIAGFAEISGDLFVSILLSILLVLIGASLFKKIKYQEEKKVIIFGCLLIILGLFPFIFIPKLLSPHYMNISVFGYALLVGLALSRFRLSKLVIILGLLILISIINVGNTFENNWVIQRSNLAQKYIIEIETANLLENSTIIFNDNPISSSRDAYIALGTGKAIDFWFEGKNYKYCFSAFENCEEK